MAVAAKCPSCGAPLSEVSVLALAPVCEHCRSVITGTGGTLGLTSAYGVNDPTITRRRVEADLAVFEEYKEKYFGMLQANKEQLNWGVEKYAKLPSPPQLLPLVEVPSFWGSLIVGLWFSFLLSLGFLFFSLIVGGFLVLIADLQRTATGYYPSWWLFISKVWDFILVSIWIIVPTLAVVPYINAKRANGSKPMENARRQKEYDAACGAATKAAVSVKAAQDHRLRSQIRELDGLIGTVTLKAEDIRQILRTS